MVEENLSLHELEERRQLDRFVGRDAELTHFRAALEASGARVLYVWGPSGVGKTTLLRAFMAEAGRRGLPIERLDARYLAPTLEAAVSALNDAGLSAYADTDGSRRVVVLDGYEYLRPVEPQVMRELLRRVQSSTVLVLAGRLLPSAQWRALSVWGEVVVPLELDNLAPHEVATYLARRGVPPEAAASVLAFSHGHPLALALAADAWQNAPRLPFSPNAAPDIVKTLYEYFAHGIVEPERRAALEVLAVLHTTSEATLAAMLECEDAAATFAWLRELSFVEPARRGLLPHELAREVILAELRWRNPDRLRALAVRAQQHLTEQMRARARCDRLELYDEFGFILGHNPKLAMMRVHPEDGLLPDVLRPGDDALIEDAVLRHEGAESQSWTRFWLEHQPSAFTAIRGADGQLAGVAAHLRLDLMDDVTRARDPRLVEAWRYAERALDVAPRVPVVFARLMMACDTYQAHSPVMAMCIHVGSRLLVSLGRCIAFARLQAGHDLSEVIGFANARFVPELAHREDGHAYEVTLNDPQRGASIEWLTAMNEHTARGRWQEPTPGADSAAARRSGAPPRPDELVAWTRDALRNLDEPLLLAKSPLTDSPCVAARTGQGAPALERAAALRAVILDELEALRGSSRGDVWHLVLEAAYVTREAKHEAIAADLGMAYSTFRRHLTAGSAALAELLWPRET